MPVQVDEVTFDTPGMRLAARVWGPEDGAPVLALHGWLDNAATFDRLAPKLDGCRVVSLDLPGHGLSDHRPPAAGYYFVDWVAPLFDLLDQLGWQQCAALGHSMGAAVLSLAVGALPERFTGLVLIEGLGPLVEEDAAAPQRLGRAILSAQRRRGKPLPVHASLQAAAARVVEATGVSPEAALILSSRGTVAVDGGVTWRTDPRLRGVSPMRLTEAQVQAFLAAITCPTLLVLAESGWPFDPELGRQRIACIPDVTVERLPGGHHLHLDDPDPIAELAKPFLKRP